MGNGAARGLIWAGTGKWPADAPQTGRERLQTQLGAGQEERSMPSPGWRRQGTNVSAGSG